MPTPEEIAAANAVQPTVEPELQPPVDSEGEPKETPEPKTFVGGKYKTPEELETAYQNLLEQNNRVQGENSQYREHYAREQSESQAREAESTSAAEEQKTGRQNAEKLLSQGRYLDAQEAVTETVMAKALKPIADRQEAQDKEAQMNAASAAFDSLNRDEKNFPGFGKLEKPMDDLFNERVANNPNYAKSFKSVRAMMASLYFESRSQHPEMLSKGREIAGAVSSGSGAGARTPGIPQAPSQGKKPRWQTDDRWSKLDMPRNAHQFEESPEDVTNRELAEQGNQIEALLAGQGVSE